MFRHNQKTTSITQKKKGHDQLKWVDSVLSPSMHSTSFWKSWRIIKAKPGNEESEQSICHVKINNNVSKIRAS